MKNRLLLSALAVGAAAWTATPAAAQFGATISSQNSYASFGTPVCHGGGNHYGAQPYCGNQFYFGNPTYYGGGYSNFGGYRSYNQGFGFNNYSRPGVSINIGNGGYGGFNQGYSRSYGGYRGRR